MSDRNLTTSESNNKHIRCSSLSLSYLNWTFYSLNTLCNPYLFFFFRLSHSNNCNLIQRYSYMNKASVFLFLRIGLQLFSHSLLNPQTFFTFSNFKTEKNKRLKPTLSSVCNLITVSNDKKKQKKKHKQPSGQMSYNPSGWWATRICYILMM